MYNIRDNSYYINYGILTSKNSLLKFSYTYLEFEEFGKIGAPASTINSEDFLGGSKPVRDTVEAIHITFTRPSGKHRPSGRGNSHIDFRR